jgi:hypothetical protein
MVLQFEYLGDSFYSGVLVGGVRTCGHHQQKLIPLKVEDKVDCSADGIEDGAQNPVGAGKALQGAVV